MGLPKSYQVYKQRSNIKNMPENTNSTTNTNARDPNVETGTNAHKPNIETETNAHNTTNAHESNIETETNAHNTTNINTKMKIKIFIHIENKCNMKSTAIFWMEHLENHMAPPIILGSDEGFFPGRAIYTLGTHIPVHILKIVKLIGKKMTETQKNNAKIISDDEKTQLFAKYEKNLLTTNQITGNIPNV